jgi:hypothetical protein
VGGGEREEITQNTLIAPDIPKPLQPKHNIRAWQEAVADKTHAFRLKVLNSFPLRWHRCNLNFRLPTPVCVPNFHFRECCAQLRARNFYFGNITHNFSPLLCERRAALKVAAVHVTQRSNNVTKTVNSHTLVEFWALYWVTQLQIKLK